MLTEELLKKVQQLEITTNRMVNEVFAGEYSTAFKGRGMEFAEVREYQPGDDIRTIDWNVTARAGTPFVKRYVEERELTIILAVDLSASGRFGSVERPKNETIAELAAVLAFAAVKNNDKVGLLIFTDEVEMWVPPKKGTNHVLRIIREVLNASPQGSQTSLTSALDYLAEVLKRRAVIFLISDFLTPESGKGDRSERAPLEKALQLVARRHDVVAISITDPREAELPPAGLVEVRDAESGRRMIVDCSSGKVRRAFEASAARRQKHLKDVFRRSGVDSVNVVTHEPYVHKLVEMFHQRERRRSRA